MTCIDERRTLVNFRTAGLLVILLMTVGGCASLEVASHWPQKPITVDGNKSEWADETFLVNDNKLTVGVANDSNFVYLMLSTSDRQLARMIVSQGLTVWFDPEGGRGKYLGIHYPLGFTGGGNDQAATAQRRTVASLSELEVLGPGSDEQHRFPVTATEGLQARFNLGNTSITYELKVPYTEGAGFPYSVKSKRGAPIGIGLETPREYAAPDQSSGGGQGSGGGRGRGGRGGSSGGTTDSDARRTQESAGPIKQWMKVQLVSPDSVRAK